MVMREGYPRYPDGLVKYAEKHNFKTILQQDRTLDYFLYSINWYSCQIINKCNKNRFSKYLKHLACYLVAPHYLESYLCYNCHGFTNELFYYQPWIINLFDKKMDINLLYINGLYFKKPTEYFDTVSSRLRTVHRLLLRCCLLVFKLWYNGGKMVYSIISLDIYNQKSVTVLRNESLYYIMV